MASDKPSGKPSGKSSASSDGEGEAPVIIKKYANRRLYNTATSSYVTLDHLCQMVKEGIDFVVHDAKTKEDITRPVLTQIIVEEESKGQNLLPVSFLRQLIGFYGDNLQCVVPGYLDLTMENFCQNQDEMRSYLSDTLGGFFPFGQFEEMNKQNMALFEQTMSMFSPFGAAGKDAKASAQGATPRPFAGSPGGSPSGPSGSSGSSGDKASSDAQKIDDLEGRLAAIQKQIEELAAKKS